MRKIKVFLSDAQVIFREGIHFTLSGEEDFEVTGESTSNDEALIDLLKRTRFWNRTHKRNPRGGEN